MKIRYPTRCVYGGETINVGHQATRYAGGSWCIEHYMEYIRARRDAILAEEAEGEEPTDG